ncbi:diguanylate cyclase [Sulfurimonas sp. ST-25]|uniref:diguanylate cyclase n=1 Tax=Sulfurimonas sp. ST-25 TaxID=3400151 RepID=UPI003A836F29
MYRINREKLLAVIREVDQAIYNHSQWYQNIIRSIVCHLPFDQRDMAEDAHHHCTFGQWYYHCSEKEMQENKTFQSIRGEHKQVHANAKLLLETSSRGEAISYIDYDNFANAVERLRLNLQTLKYELEETLYNRDPLTGVRNRISMLSDLRKQMDLIDRHVDTTVIAILDVDHFKKVNDTHGHPVGDLVLANIAAYILQHLRPYDNVYRYGGEEFLIMMPHTDVETAAAVIERIREGVAQMQTHMHNGETISVTISAGVTKLRDHHNIETAIEEADKALYEAKLGGRNKSVVSA